MFDLRYHISSLVAVFLALGIGILVGSTVVGDDLLAREQKGLIDRLEQDFVLLREQNRSFKEEVLATRQTVQQQKSFAEAVLPLVVRERLAGLRVAVIKTGYGGDPGELLRGLKSAGASVQSVTTLNGEFRFRDPGMVQELLNRQERKSSVDSLQLAPQVARMLGEDIYRKEASGILHVLRELNVITSDGEYGQPVDVVLLLGGSQGEQDDYFRTLDLPLIQFFQENRVRVIGTEFSDAENSYIKYYRNQKITTVDNVDTVPGLIALVLALAGSDGHFGVKVTAEQILPEIPPQTTAKTN